MQSFFDGLTVWAYNVLPALFPFAVLSAIALKIVPRHKYSLTKSLFGIACDKEFATALLCGYPMGAKAISDSNADVDTATRMCAFCSTAGPIFMIATVGAKLLQNSVATAIVVFSHFLSAIINGFIYRRREQIVLDRNSDKLVAEDLGNTLTSSVLSVLSVGGLIALFYMFSDMLKSFFPQTIADSLPIAYAIGILEMTNGVFAICKSADLITATILCSGLLALGGMCVFFQCYAFLGKKKINAINVIKMKLTQSAIATIVSFCLAKLLL